MSNATAHAGYEMLGASGEQIEGQGRADQGTVLPVNNLPALPCASCKNRPPLLDSQQHRALTQV